jgi:hypothetical protein
MPAPVASGWSGCRVGLAPTGKRRLSRRTRIAVIESWAASVNQHNLENPAVKSREAGPLPQLHDVFTMLPNAVEVQLFGGEI